MTLYIVRRVIRPDPETGRERIRWHVRYQHRRVNGGKVVHLGVFDTERRAKTRLRLAKDELAEGRVPQRFQIVEAPALAERMTAELAAEWLATRHDVADSTLRGMKQKVATIPAWLAAMDPHAITHADVQRYATEMAANYKRATIAMRIGILRQVLDYAGVNPNPASDRRVRLPRGERRAYRLPNRRQIAELHERIPWRSTLMTLLEHTGLRIEEAAALRWGDIDQERDRLLVGDAKTTAGVRWVEHLPGTPAFPERPQEGADDRALVFTKPSASSMTGALAYAHTHFGTFMMSAHDFRHLHASRLLHEGILSPAQIAARLGHASPGITLGTYSHVVPPD